MILTRLDDVGLLREVWHYFIPKDIIRLMMVNKIVLKICLKINKVVPQEIILNLDNLSRNRQHKANLIFFVKKIISSFPNITKFEFLISILLAYSENSMDESLLSLCDSSSVCQNIQELFIPKLTAKGMTGISKLINIKSLNISYSDITNNNVWSEILSMTTLTSLDISAVKRFTGDKISDLTKLVNLNELKMVYCFNKSNFGFRYLSLLTNLTSLDISNSIEVRNAELTHLSSLNRINKLNISHTSITTVYSLSSLMNITSLNMNGCELTDEGISHISSLTNITYLDLSRCNEISIDGLSSFKTLINLKTLLFANPISVDELEFISSLTSLEKLCIKIDNLCNSRCKGKPLLHIRKLNKLKSFLIEFGFCKINDFNLSDGAIKMFVNLPHFELVYAELNLLPKKNVTKGLFHVMDLRKEKK